MFQRRKTRKAWMVRGIVAAVLAAVSVVIALEPWAPYRQPEDTGQEAKIPLPPVAAPSQAAQPIEPHAGAGASSGRVIARPWSPGPVSPRQEAKQFNRGRQTALRTAGRGQGAERGTALPERSGITPEIAVRPRPTAHGGEPVLQMTAETHPLPTPIALAAVQPAAANAVQTPPLAPVSGETGAIVAETMPDVGRNSPATALPANGQQAAVQAKEVPAPAVPYGASAVPYAHLAPQPWPRHGFPAPPPAPIWIPATPRHEAVMQFLQPPVAAYVPAIPVPPVSPPPRPIPVWVPVLPATSAVVPMPTGPMAAQHQPTLQPPTPPSAGPVPILAAGQLPRTAAVASTPAVPDTAAELSDAETAPSRPAAVADAAPLPSVPASQVPATPAPAVLVAQPVAYAGLAAAVPGPNGQPQMLMFPPFAMIMALCNVPLEVVKAAQRSPLQ